jgi:hypothetical protein
LPLPALEQRFVGPFLRRNRVELREFASACGMVAPTPSIVQLFVGPSFARSEATLASASASDTIIC